MTSYPKEDRQLLWCIDCLLYINAEEENYENWIMALTKDIECHTLQKNPLLLPTVTSFIPGLPTGAAFRASIHCWQNPVFSRYIQNLKKPSDNVIFEARLFIDGRMAG